MSIASSGSSLKLKATLGIWMKMITTFDPAQPLTIETCIYAPPIEALHKHCGFTTVEGFLF